MGFCIRIMLWLTKVLIEDPRPLGLPETFTMEPLGSQLLLLGLCANARSKRRGSSEQQALHQAISRRRMDEKEPRSPEGPGRPISKYLAQCFFNKGCAKRNQSPPHLGTWTLGFLPMQTSHRGATHFGASLSQFKMQSIYLSQGHTVC